MHVLANAILPIVVNFWTKWSTAIVSWCSCLNVKLKAIHEVVKLWHAAASQIAPSVSPVVYLDVQGHFVRVESATLSIKLKTIRRRLFVLLSVRRPSANGRSVGRLRLILERRNWKENSPTPYKSSLNPNKTRQIGFVWGEHSPLTLPCLCVKC